MREKAAVSGEEATETSGNEREQRGSSGEEEAGEEGAGAHTVGVRTRCKVLVRARWERRGAKVNIAIDPMDTGEEVFGLRSGRKYHNGRGRGYRVVFFVPGDSRRDASPQAGAGQSSLPSHARLGCGRPGKYQDGEGGHVTSSSRRPGVPSQATPETPAGGSVFLWAEVKNSIRPQPEPRFHFPRGPKRPPPILLEVLI